jgi:hypothetical protein
MDNMNDETLNKLVVMLADEYEKCAAIKKHIDKINTILDKL